MGLPSSVLVTLSLLCPLLSQFLATVRATAPSRTMEFARIDLQEFARIDESLPLYFSVEVILNWRGRGCPTVTTVAAGLWAGSFFWVGVNSPLPPESLPFLSFHLCISLALSLTPLPPRSLSFPSGIKSYHRGGDVVGNKGERNRSMTGVLSQSSHKRSGTQLQDVGPFPLPPPPHNIVQYSSLLSFLSLSLCFHRIPTDRCCQAAISLPSSPLKRLKILDFSCQQGAVSKHPPTPPPHPHFHTFDQHTVTLEESTFQLRDWYDG